MKVHRVLESMLGLSQKSNARETPASIRDARVGFTEAILRMGRARDDLDKMTKESLADFNREHPSHEAGNF